MSCCKRVGSDINTRHAIVLNILLNNILVQRGLISHEKWEDKTIARTSNDETIGGTKHLRYDEWQEEGRVAGAKLKPELVWLMRDSGGQRRKVGVDVKVTSTDKMNEAFRGKDDKYREWATKETREKRVTKSVMFSLIISHDGAVHNDSVRRWKNFAPTSRSTGCGWSKMTRATMW